MRSSRLGLSRVATVAALSAPLIAGSALLAAPAGAATAPSSNTARAAGVSAADVVRVHRYASELRKIRRCESGGNYRINTHNGYYGAYQFAAATWRGLGYRGLPNQASPAVQDAAAAKLLARAGHRPWGSCA